MAVYSVFEPLPRRGETTARPEQFRFVRDGFSWGALLFGPLWMVAQRLWLVLILYLVLAAALSALLQLTAVPADGQFAVAALLALLLGFEGATLQRWTLQRRGWRDLGIVVADDLEAAERRFFDGWVAGETAAFTGAPRREVAAPSWPLAPPPGAAGAHSAPDVIGLFPEPGTKR